MTKMAEQHEGVWVLSEQADKRIKAVSHELLTRGRALADKRRTSLTAVVIGHETVEADLEALIARGADRVLVMEAPELARFLVEPHAACLARLIREERPEIVIAAATTQGRTLMPYAAILVGAGLTADCTVLDIDAETGHLLQTRPAIGGNILATIQTPEHRPQMATVRPRSAPPAPIQEGRQGEIVRVQATPECLGSRIEFVRFVPDTSEHGLQEADAVVAVGRGIRRAENVDVVRPLAKVLDAALGASRDVVDRGWLSYPHQVGLSGKTVSPRLYVAVGISGSVQHLAGMQTSETVVAVNSDPDAPIFSVADVGIVGDLFEVVPAVVEKLRDLRGKG
jgi:electron transfer flavoprotein alpha subunit